MSERFVTPSVSDRPDVAAFWTPVEGVDAYLATLPYDEQQALQRLRALIKETVSKVEERISYGMAVMFSPGRDLVGFVSQPKYLSFFTASPKLKGEIAKTHTVSGATIHFSPENPLPPAVCRT